MGLFSRKKKPSTAEIAAAESARRKAAADAAAAAAKEKEEKVKMAAEQQKQKEEKILADITAKRKDIAQLERALNGFEEQRRREAMLAKRARETNKMNEAKAHLRNATRLKNRIAQYTNQVVQNQTQLDALEDAAFQRQGLQSIKKFTENVNEMQQDPAEIDDALQDMREAMAGVNEVNLTMQADASLNKGMYDTEDAMAELDALEAEYADEAASAIPNVPGEVPAMPAGSAPAVTAASTEEEEIRRLERDVML